MLSKVISALTFAIMAFVTTYAEAQPLRVAATTTNMGMLVQEIGGDTVMLSVLAPPHRDTHTLTVRPNMIAAVRRAELLVAVGGELEIGWLPAVIQAAHNPAVHVERKGYFEVARKVTLIHGGKPADRALGDVHPQGNPHVYLDPVRMLIVAEALSQRLAALRPQYADLYQQNYQRFEKRLLSRMDVWFAQAEHYQGDGMLLFHDDASYLLARFNIPLLGYLEPLAGLPPTERHLQSLQQQHRHRRNGSILQTIYQPSGAAASLSQTLQWPYYSLPAHVEGDTMTLDGYITIIDSWLRAIIAPSSPAMS